MRILSFEVNPALRPDLEFVSRFVPNFAFRMEALSSTERTLPFHVPESSRIDLSQEGTTNLEFLRRRLAGFAPELVGTVSVRTSTVQALPLDALELHPSIIKIDVQAAEADVLLGMDGTIRRHLPALLVEINSKPALELLRAWGYQVFTWRAGRLRAGRTKTNTIALHPASVHWSRFATLFE
jgi:FkbM family methyltransferase